MKSIKKWLAAAGAGLAVIAMAAVAVPTNTVSAASAQHGVGPGGQQAIYLADALGVTVDELTSAYTAARAAAIDQAVADGLLTQEQADSLNSATGRFGNRGFGHIIQGATDKGALLAEQLGISVDELQAAQTTANNARLAAAVEAGQITQEQADMMQAQHALRQYLSQEDVRASLQSAYSDAVQQAVTAGAITQEQADAILSNSNGFGLFGGMRGHGRGHGGMRQFRGPASHGMAPSGILLRPGVAPSTSGASL